MKPSKLSAESRLAVQFSVSRLLLGSQDPGEVVPAVLRTIGEGFDWHFGAFWTVNPNIEKLICMSTWQKTLSRAEDFDDICRKFQFASGEGLPGRVWKSGKPWWLPDLKDDKNLPRINALTAAGLRSGVSFSVTTASGFLGVIEFFSRQLQTPDPTLLEDLTTLGHQVGQYLDRKKSEQTLRESEARFRKLADAAPVLIWLSGPDKLCTYLNKGWLDFTGRHLGESLRQGWAESIHPEDLARSVQTYIRSFDSRQEFKMEYRLRRRDGEFRWVLNHGIPLFLPNGEFTGYIGSCVDIQDQKLTAQELEKKIAERTEALERTSLLHAQTQAELHQARNLEAVGRLAGGVAHDFNNLMTGILGVCQELLDDGALADGSRADIQEIFQAASRAAALTKQLLAFGRRQIATPKIINLNSTIVDMQSLLKRLIGSDIEFSFYPDTTLGNARIDPGQVEQILVNLVMNSKDAMPGGGSITIETRNVELNRTDSRRHFEVRPGPYVMLAISDTGAGMTPDVQAHAFEPFYTTKKEKGTGLGLATVYGITKQNGGDIFIYSDPGKGTTVKVYLPRVDAVAERETSKGPDNAPKTPQGNETILVVEDENLVRRMAVKALVKSGYNVLEAKTGKEAMEICASYTDPIHLLLTDVIMPGLNGRQLAELLAPSRPAMKVLYMSGYTENVIVTRGILKPGISFIEKTYTGGQLCHKVREVMDSQSSSLDAAYAPTAKKPQ